MTLLAPSEFFSLNEYCDRRRLDIVTVLKRAARGKIYLSKSQPISFYYREQTKDGKIKRRCKHIFGYIHPDDVKQLIENDSVEIRRASPSELGRSSKEKPHFYKFTKKTETIVIRKKDLVIHRRYVSAYKTAPPNHKLLQLERMIQRREFNEELNAALDIYSYYWRLFIATNEGAAEKYNINADRLYRNLTRYDSKAVNTIPCSQTLFELLYSFTPQAKLRTGRKQNMLIPAKDKEDKDLFSTKPPTEESIKDYIENAQTDHAISKIALERVSYLARPTFYTPRKIPHHFKKVSTPSSSCIRKISLNFLELPLPLRVSLEAFHECQELLNKTSIEELTMYVEYRYNTSFASLNSRKIAESIKTGSKTKG